MKKYEYSNTSLILHWCTQEHGLVRMIAKGANQPSNALCGKLDLYRELEVEWQERSQSDLQLLKSAHVESLSAQITRYENILSADYFVKIVEACNEPDTPIEPWYDLLKRAMRFLGEEKASLKAVLHFEREAAKLHGVWSEHCEPVERLASGLDWYPRKERAKVLEYVR